MSPHKIPFTVDNAIMPSFFSQPHTVTLVNIDSEYRGQSESATRNRTLVDVYLNLIYEETHSSKVLP